MKLESAIMERILVGIFRTSALLLNVLALSPSVGALSCYECHSETSCKTPQHRECDSQFDACVLQTLWIGELYMTVNMSRYCGSSSQCPRTSAEKTPFCEQTGDVLTCTMCCNDGDFCNNGGSGKLLRPPPYPPIPEPLVKRLAGRVCNKEGDSFPCETSLSWTEESTVVNVVAVCGVEATTSEVTYSTAVVDTDMQCQNTDQYETGFCVTCRADGQSAIPILLLVCQSLRWLLSS